MKTIGRIVLLLILILTIYLIFKLEFTINEPEDLKRDNGIVQKVKQGKVTVVNVDASSNLPIKDTEYAVIDSKSGTILESLLTDEDGKATSSLLDYGKSYILKQVNIMEPYRLNEESVEITITRPNRELIITNVIPDFVKAYKRTEDGKIQVTDLFIPVPIIMQKPELPKGPEITSLTSILNYEGFDVEKTELADHYLPKEPFKRKNNKLFGPNPEKAYAGEPRQTSGFFSFTPPIVEAANQYFADKESHFRAVDISGSPRKKIMDLLTKGIPVVIWVTSDLSQPNKQVHWSIFNTGEKYAAPINLHVVVLNGYSGEEVYAMDPLRGQVTVDATLFFQSYEALGSHALLIEEDKKAKDGN